MITCAVCGMPAALRVECGHDCDPGRVFYLCMDHDLEHDAARPHCSVTCEGDC